jgi:hypothetical protein
MLEIGDSPVQKTSRNPKTMTKILTFYTFVFRANHWLAGRSQAASHTHWHTYAVKLWFDDQPDQDDLSRTLESKFSPLHGSNLPAIIADTTDEGIALWFLKETGCAKVVVTNDGRRGAEASR